MTALTEQSYESDDLLQRFLASYPDWLAGEQIDTTQPRRWLLVDREVRVPDSEDGSGRLSLDHLFLDQDAVPTFVEVKRASDQRIRREVVGQMLDYAANALAYFPPDSLRTTFKARCEKERLDGPALLGSLICDTDPEVFWQKVKQICRLAACACSSWPTRSRPSCAASSVLNRQMDPAEVPPSRCANLTGRHGGSSCR